MKSRLFMLLTWLVTLAGVGLLWSVARIDEVQTEPLFQLRIPPPEVFVALLCVSVLGGIYLAAHGLWKLRTERSAAIIRCFGGLGTLCATGSFVHEIFTNDDSAIPVNGDVNKPHEPVQKLRLFCLNVLHGHPDFPQHNDRFEATARILCHFKADVMIFQEVWNTNEHGNMADRSSANMNRPLNYAYARANGSRSRIGFEEGAAILSGLPIIEAKRMLLKPREPWWENRIALMTKLDLGGGETLTLVGVHLSDSAAAASQADYLLEIMREHSPDLIAGDFNSTPDACAVQAMLKQGYSTATPMIAIHGMKQFELPDQLIREPPIDHVFLSRAFRERFSVEEVAWVVTSKPVTGDDIHQRIAISDHNAILVDLKRR